MAHDGKNIIFIIKSVLLHERTIKWPINFSLFSIATLNVQFFSLSLFIAHISFAVCKVNDNTKKILRFINRKMENIWSWLKRYQETWCRMRKKWNIQQHWGKVFFREEKMERYFGAISNWWRKMFAMVRIKWWNEDEFYFHIFFPLSENVSRYTSK